MNFRKLDYFKSFVALVNIAQTFGGFKSDHTWDWQHTDNLDIVQWLHVSGMLTHGNLN